MRIEPGHEIYHHYKQYINFSDFHLKWSEVGVDFGYHIELVDFNVDISQLIGKKFKRFEELNAHVLEAYLIFRAQSINFFNHHIDTYLRGTHEMKEVSFEYRWYTRLAKKAEEKHDFPAVAKFNRIKDLQAKAFKAM